MPRFARDVLTNVVANLIAAAVIYLLGLAVGIFPTVDGLVLIAAVILTGGAAAVPFAVSDLVQPDRRRRWVRYGAYGAIAFGSVAVGTGTYAVIMRDGWVAVATLALLICVGIAAIGGGVWTLHANPLLATGELRESRDGGVEVGVARPPGS
jgi:MFS family permease